MRSTSARRRHSRETVRGIPPVRACARDSPRAARHTRPAKATRRGRSPQDRPSDCPSRQIRGRSAPRGHPAGSARCPEGSPRERGEAPPRASQNARAASTAVPPPCGNGRPSQAPRPPLPRCAHSERASSADCPRPSASRRSRAASEANASPGGNPRGCADHTSGCRDRTP